MPGFEFTSENYGNAEENKLHLSFEEIFFNTY